MNIKKIVILFSMLVIVQIGFAQPTDEVEVLETFNAQLQKSDKLKTSPTLPQVTTTTQTLKYGIPTKLLTLQYEPPIIRPLGMKREKPPKTYNFYTKLGYGTPNSPYAELSYSGIQKKKFRYNVYGKHHSANNDKNVQNQRFSHTDLGADGVAYLKDFAVGGNIGYTMDGHQFYGYADTLDFARDSVRQSFNDFHIGAELFNSKLTRGDLNYKANLNFYNRQDYYSAVENGVRVSGNITKYFDDNPLDVLIVNDFSNFNQDTVNATNNVLSMRPTFTYNADAFQVTVGGNAGLDSSFYIFPHIEASVNVYQDKFMVIAGWTGEVEKNTFRTLTRENPYILTNTTMKNTRFQKRYVGVRGVINKFNMEFTVAQKPTTNLVMYLNDSMDTKRLSVIYDDANIFTIHGAVTAHDLIEHLDLTAALDIHTYNNLAVEAAAWHLPNVEFNASAIYHMMEDKLALKASLYTMNDVTYLDANRQTAAYNLVDLSVGASFQATKNIGIFLDLNNLTNTKFQRWHNYPTYGFNIMGGITAKF